VHLRLLVIAALVLLYALPACAQQLALSTDVDYLFVDRRLRDPDQRVSTSGFFPRVDLSLTGPVRPGSHLYLDLTGGIAENTFGTARQSDNDMRLVVRGEDPRYRLALRHGQSHFASATDGLGPSVSRLTADTKETDLTLILREPAYPVLNLQYSRFAADSALAGVSSNTETTASRVAAIYDLAPVRLRFDENRRSSEVLGGGTSGSDSRRFGASLDSALIPKLSLFADLQLSRWDTRFGSGGGTGSTDRTGILRLSAVPTPKVAIDAELRSQLTDSLADAAPSNLSVNGSSIAMRSEVLPGIQLNVARDVDNANRAGLATDTSSTYLDLLARLDARNSALVSLSPRRVSLEGVGDIEQNAAHVSWASQLDARTDLTVNWDRFTDNDPTLGLTRTTSKYLAVRYRPDLQTTVGVGLLWNNANLQGSASTTTQAERVLATDISWLPTQKVSLGYRFSLTRLSGSSNVRMSVPALDLRWQPDMLSDFALNWRLQSTAQREFDDLNRFDFTTFSSHFRRKLSRGSTLNIDYSVVKFSEGPLAHERVFRISIETRAGR
jgi:hypothetical protein